MRKLLLLAVFALMMTSCAARPAITADEAREKWPDGACTLRAEFDCGDKAVVYTLRVEESDGETVMTVLEPESLAGLTAFVAGSDAKVTFGGAVFGVPDFAETSVLPSPLSIVPALTRGLRDGIVTSESSGKIGTADAAVIDAAYNVLGEPWVVRTYVGADARPLRAEASRDGAKAVTADFLSWE